MCIAGYMKVYVDLAPINSVKVTRVTPSVICWSVLAEMTVDTVILVRTL